MRLIRTSGVFPINSRTELTLQGSMTISKPAFSSYSEPRMPSIKSLPWQFPRHGNGGRLAAAINPWNAQ